MRVFLGITGASGAPYALRLLDGLLTAGCEVGVSVSDAGYEVIATEVLSDPSMSEEAVRERAFGERPGLTVYDAGDFSAPYASGSARVDGYVICPCSMATVGTIAAGAMANLVHRAASVALKEGRRLVLVPRETPLSTIHLENLLRLRQAGAVVLPAAPGFYHGAETIDDLINFVVSRVLDQLGVANELVPRWGEDS